MKKYIVLQYEIHQWLSPLLLGGMLLTCTEPQGDLSPPGPKMEAISKVERGRYWVDVIGCNDCHSPKRFGPEGPQEIAELSLSGFPQDRPLPPIDLNAVESGWVMFVEDGTASVGPWGVSFAGNLTSDATGIGNWTEENFIRAIKDGKLKGLEDERDLLPPMPWTLYRNLTDDDLAAIFAYLQTVPAVANVVPPPIAWENLK
ncbi:MAG: diheme cytochrome c-553 [Saprospiraceae bacterium]|nr:diheme cytochrome c-553 [Saprospiraceae bacterium]